MWEFWALWLFSLMLRGLGIIGFGLTLITACIASTVPFVGVLWFIYGSVFSLTLYGAGQFVLLMMSIHDSSSRTSGILGIRGRRPAAPRPDDPHPVQYTQEPDASPRPMGYSRRYRPAPPDVPADDPRHVRTYRRQVVYRDAPESRIPRPKAKG